MASRPSAGTLLLSNFGVSRISASWSARPAAGITPPTGATKSTSTLGSLRKGDRSNIGKVGLPSAFTKSPLSATRNLAMCASDLLALARLGARPQLADRLGQRILQHPDITR